MKTTLETIVNQADCIIKNSVNLDDLNLTLTDVNSIIEKLAPLLYQMQDLVTSREITLEEEIYCFKQAKPMLLGRIMFFQKVYEIMTTVPFGMTEVRKSFYINKQEEINKYMSSNIELYQYYRSSADNLDEYYFTKTVARHLAH